MNSQDNYAIFVSAFTMPPDMRFSETTNSYFSFSPWLHPLTRGCGKIKLDQTHSQFLSLVAFSISLFVSCSFQFVTPWTSHYTPIRQKYPNSFLNFQSLLFFCLPLPMSSSASIFFFFSFVFLFLTSSSSSHIFNRCLWERGEE